MKTLLAITALSLSATFTTPAFSQAAPALIRDAIAACALDRSTCVEQFAALDLSTLNSGQRRAVANALLQAAAENPSISAPLTELADAVVSGEGTEEIIANLASPA